MAQLSDLIAYLDELLDAGSFGDYAPNGLQVPGREEVQSVVTGVSAHLELFERAADLGAGLVLVHHGLFWNNAPRALDVAMARKLRLLLTREIALAAYHLPLDAHLEHGNNALLAGALGAQSWVPFGSAGGQPIGVAASFAEPLPKDELIARVRAATGGREPLAFAEGPDEVARVGIVSGAAADSVNEAIAAGLDAFITGEPAERVMAIARENAITFIAAGHHATEVFGVSRLGDLLAERFGLAHQFVDVPNPI